MRGTGGSRTTSSLFDEDALLLDYPPLSLYQLGRGHKLIECEAQTCFKLIKIGIHGYSWVFHEYSEEICEYIFEKHYTKKIGGYSVFVFWYLGKVFVNFFAFLKMFENKFEYRIPSNTLGYFGILWNALANTLEYFAEYLYKKMEYQKQRGLLCILFEYPLNTMEYPCPCGIPSNTRVFEVSHEYLAKIVEYYY